MTHTGQAAQRDQPVTRSTNRRCLARGTAVIATVAVCVPLASLGTALDAQTAGSGVTSFPVSMTFPRDITAGPDGAVWFSAFTDTGVAAIGRITSAGVVRILGDPFRGGLGGLDSLNGITAGSDGALWVTQGANFFFGKTGSIARITTTGTVTDYTDPSISDPSGITMGPDGAIWFTNGGDFNAGGKGSIGRITTGGTVTNYTDPSISTPNAITVGPDGALWFTNHYGRSIGRITTSGTVTNYTDPAITYPNDITTGPDGALWFTNYNEDQDEAPGSIGRITTAGTVTGFTDPQMSQPFGITAGADGAMWFTNDGFRPSIMRITITGSVSNFTDPNITQPGAMAAGPDHALWFIQSVDADGAAIARITTGLSATAPGSPSAVAGNGRATVHWTAPSSSGGSKTTSYIVTPYVGGDAQNPHIYMTTATAQTVTGLENGGLYRFRVAAQNANGIGAWSGLTNAVRVGAPLAPTSVGLKTIASGTLQVTFKAPANNGAPINGYVATCESFNTGQRMTQTGKAAPITVTGLKHGNRYGCTVVANNKRGLGPPSALSAPVKV